MVDENKEGITFTQEDIDAINADITKAKETLVGAKKPEEKQPDASSLKDEIKAQIMAEMKAEAAAKAEAQEKANLQSELERQKQEASQKLADLQSKVDKLTESKAVVNVKSPFTGEEKDFDSLLQDDNKMKAIDDASRDEFFKQRG